MTLREELAAIDSEKRDAHESLSDVVLLSVWTGTGLGAAWLIKIIVVWACSWMTLGAKVVGGLIVIPPLIWLAWNWFCIWLACVWELSQPIRFWVRDSFQSLDGCGSKIGDALIKGILGLCGLVICVPVIIFTVIGNVAALLPIPIGIVGFALMGFGGADWIHRTFDKIDELNECEHVVSPIVEKSKQIDWYVGNGGAGNHIQLDNLGGLVNRIHTEFSSDVYAAYRPVDIAENQRLLGVLSERRARFGRQIAFWESMQNKKYCDIQIIGLTEMRQAYGMQMSMESVDVELLLEVLKATAAEYDRQIAILKEGI